MSTQPEQPKRKSDATVPATAGHDTKMTPREYGKLRGIAPQLIYYHIREHGDKISLERCLCGRSVIDVKTADEYFGKGEFE